MPDKSLHTGGIKALGEYLQQDKDLSLSNLTYQDRILLFPPGDFLQIWISNLDYLLAKVEGRSRVDFKCGNDLG